MDFDRCGVTWTDLAWSTCIMVVVVAAMVYAHLKHGWGR